MSACGPGSRAGIESGTVWWGVVVQHPVRRTHMQKKYHTSERSQTRMFLTIRNLGIRALKITFPFVADVWRMCVCACVCVRARTGVWYVFRCFETDCALFWTQLRNASFVVRTR